jgi:hypothetical protein
MSGGGTAAVFPAGGATDRGDSRRTQLLLLQPSFRPPRNPRSRHHARVADVVGRKLSLIGSREWKCPAIHDRSVVASGPGGVMSAPAKEGDLTDQEHPFERRDRLRPQQGILTRLRTRPSAGARPPGTLTSSWGQSDDTPDNGDERRTRAPDRVVARLPHVCGASVESPRAW